MVSVRESWKNRFVELEQSPTSEGFLQPPYLRDAGSLRSRKGYINEACAHLWYTFEL